MKIFLAILLVLFFSSSYNQVFKGDSIYIKKSVSLLTDSNWQGAVVAITAKDLTDNKLMIDYNGSLKLTPASIVKLITTGAALHILSPSFRFKTEFYYSGEIHDSILNGDVIIRGYGDPTLYSRFFKTFYEKNSPFDTLAIILKNRGIKYIKGRIIGDASFFDYNLPTSTWIVGDVANYFGASPCGLNIYNNEYSLYFKTSDTIAPAILKNIYPDNIPIELKNFLKGGKVSNDQSIIYGGLFDSTRIVVGLIPLKSDSFEVRGSIPNPPLLAANFLQEVLEKQGISVADAPAFRMEYNYVNDTTEKKQLIYTHYSPNLSQIINLTNLYSINLFAENIARLCGYEQYKSTTTESGTLAINRFWKNKTGEMLLYDASGLSRFNGVSTQQFVSVLEYMYTKSSYKKVFYNSLAVAGENGTLSKMFLNSKAKGKVIAKTGTMTNIRSLSGYIQTKEKHTIAFTIIVNNCPQSSKWIKEKIEQIILKLFFE
ncbi:MAG TPA: D-alanyl-D-alanine carboxypeptidase/D-alanyl-D-alanine-endopeptidase [Bacteroidales bacterium]|nr:D-alanyl-D-alanine carboxypeptidase/D-alanyl-D-alanine-endopeptidase [Bacteroidales bacterium]HNV95150.1 D-alanyl-D-alanine carboxypeptidase/D-alanyl-D-alanine-endopeptidase [Bacteroidales bacterium]